MQLPRLPALFSILSSILTISAVLLAEDSHIEFIAKGIHPLFSSSHWGVHVIDLDNKQVLYTHNDSQLFIPASVTKLFTTAAALEILGPSHLFETHVKASVLPDKEGVLKGNLYLVGGGDPSLTSAGLHELAKGVYQAGIRTIFGKVIIDDTLFNGCSLPTHGEWEDLSWDYAAEESALSVNDNSVEVTILTNSSGVGLANVKIEQDVPYCQLFNRVTTNQAMSGIAITRGLTDNIIEVKGMIPADSIPIKRKIAIHQPQEYAKTIFLKALQDLGIILNEIAHQDINEELHEIASISSAPLLSIIHKINKHSDNLCANILLKHLNRRIASPEASVSNVTPAIHSFLARASIPYQECALYDGSGLSRHNLMTPKHTVKLLEYMSDHPYKAEFLESLACSGGNGTLENRFSKDLFPGVVVKAKTGSMSGISNLAGFIYLSDGRRLVFTIFINHSLWSGKETSEALDKLLLYMVKKSHAIQ